MEKHRKYWILDALWNYSRYCKIWIYLLSVLCVHIHFIWEAKPASITPNLHPAPKASIHSLRREVVIVTPCSAGLCFCVGSDGNGAQILQSHNNPPLVNNIYKFHKHMSVYFCLCVERISRNPYNLSASPLACGVFSFLGSVLSNLLGFGQTTYAMVIKVS